MNHSQKTLGAFSLALLNISAIISLRHLSSMALLGPASLVIYVGAAVVFLIPISMICAELATSWPERGGMYQWILLSFGPRAALLVVWWGWMAGLTTMLLQLMALSSFTALTFFPEYVGNTLFTTGLGTVVLWTMTLINMLGMRESAALSSFGAIVGTMIPIFLLVLFAGYWLASGHTGYFDLQDLWITPSYHHLIFFQTVVLGFCGIEVAAFHAADAIDPQRTYSKAIALSVVAIVVLYIFGTLAFCIMIPKQEIHLIGGIVQLFQNFFGGQGGATLGLIVNSTVILGTLAAANTWLIAPAKGIFAATDHFVFPSFFSKTSRTDVPYNLLLSQAVLATCILVANNFSDSLEGYFLFLTSLTTQICLLIYLFMIGAVVVLRRRYPKHYRPFKIQAHHMKWVIGLSSFSCLTVLMTTFLPSSQFSSMDVRVYEGMICVGLGVVSAPAFFFKLKPNYKEH